MGTPGTKPLANILIVDDTPANLRLLSQMLTEHGYLARPVLNGLQALSAAQIIPPDLILLDIRMPAMDGYELCARLKADARTREIPVLFISALSETEDKVRAFVVGGVDYISKPFQTEEVLARVRTHLALRDLQKQLQQQIAERDSLIADLQAYAHTVAHDLRDPVASALGVVQLLQHDDADFLAVDREAFMAGLADSLRKLNNIISELLLLAEVRKTEIQVAPLVMKDIVAGALTRIEPALRGAGATVTQPERWPAVRGYAPWLEEVWVNYLSNAIKYGGKPPLIAVGADAAVDGTVRFWVQDNGPGLTTEQQVQLFTPFTRFDQARAQGHGLGLSIVQRIVAKLNGQVGVDSAGIPGQGCTFYFTLPSVPANNSF